MRSQSTQSSTRSDTERKCNYLKKNEETEERTPSIGAFTTAYRIGRNDRRLIGLLFTRYFIAFYV
jgi:hypothetical protein